MKNLLRDRFIILLLSFIVLTLTLVFENAKLQNLALFFIPLAGLLALWAKFTHGDVRRSVIYIITGISCFIAIADLFRGSLYAQISFIPFLAFAIVNAIAALLVYSDSYKSGAVFVVSSLIAFLIAWGPSDFGSIDAFLLSIALFALSSYSFAHMVSNAEDIRDALLGIIKACIIAAILVSVVFSIKAYKAGITDQKKLMTLFLDVAWYSVVSNFFVIMIFIILFEMFVLGLDYRRVFEDGKVVFAPIREEDEKPEEREEEEKDPYIPLIKEMRIFKESLGKVDTIELTDTIGRFAEELSFLAAQHDTPKRQEAERLLEEIRRAGTKAQAEKMKPFSLPESEKISTILVFGPMHSMKKEFCYGLLKTELEKGNKVGIITRDRKEQEYWFKKHLQKNLLENLIFIEVRENLTEAGVGISKSIEKWVKLVYFSLLPTLLLKEKFENVIDFVSFNTEKLKKAGVRGIFLVESESISAINLSSLELLFDCVLEMKMPEGESTPWIMVRNIVGAPADTTWKRVDVLK
ncbi:MAG: hypothetical protein QXP42_04990 [Candidatus Micrarchaeia archaeon]